MFLGFETRTFPQGTHTVEDAAAFFAEKARDAGLTLEAAVAPGIPAFSFDPDLVAQVLANLVSNALKFTPRGGRVRVSAALEGAQAVVRVEDDGVGVPEEARARIFTPFERVANPLRATGTGLGLSIAHGVIDGHGRAPMSTAGLGEIERWLEEQQSKAS